jgi:hypothetical protein
MHIIKYECNRMLKYNSISVRLRNLIRGGLGPIWVVSAIGWMDGWIF